MKKLLLFALLAVMLIGFDSCKKQRFCQCYAVVDGKDVSLGEDVELSQMTAATIDSLDSRYNVYIIETGTCNDKAKEIVGWGQVTCREVSPKADTSWLSNLFNRNKNKNNNNSGNKN